MGKTAKKGKKVTKKAKKTAKKGKKVVPKKAVVRIHGLKKVVKCKISKNMRCGPSHNHTRCPFGWCSKWGWCGMSKLHKSTHQVKYDATPACAAKRKLTLI